MSEEKETTPNMQKYYNYREQMTRLKKALNQSFYLEAVFIEYAMMEDRLESILRHAGVWKEPDPNKKLMGLEQKMKKAAKVAEEKKSLAHKYFDEDLFARIDAWRQGRNPLTHVLMKLNLHTEDLETMAMEGYDIVKILCSKSTSYKRAIEKKNSI